MNAVVSYVSLPVVGVSDIVTQPPERSAAPVKAAWAAGRMVGTLGARWVPKYLGTWANKQFQSKLC